MKAIFAVARALVWAGLKHEDRSLTIERVGDLLGRYMRETGGTVDTVLEVTFAAAVDQGAMGRPEPEPVDEPSGNVPTPVETGDPVSQ